MEEELVEMEYDVDYDELGIDLSENMSRILDSVPPEIKSGVKTSEFWMTLGAQIVSLLVLLGYVGAPEVDQLTGEWDNVVEGVFAVILSATTLWKYFDSRTKVKVASTNNTATM